MKNNERSSRLAQGRTESALMLRSRAHARGVSKHGPRDRSPHPSRRRFAPPQDEASKAPPRGPRWLVRSPVFSCFFAKIGTVPVRGGRGSAMHHSLTLALHRVRDAKARTRLPTPIHFSNSPCLQDERLRAAARGEDFRRDVSEARRRIGTTKGRSQPSGLHGGPDSACLGPQRTPIRGRICERGTEYQRMAFSAVAAPTHRGKCHTAAQRERVRREEFCR
jgi:hypothetical protein